MSFPLRITDAALFELELDEALVLAATCGYPNRNPSLTQLAATTGLHRASVKIGQDKLEACLGRPYVEGEGAKVLTGGELIDQMRQMDANVPPPVGWHRARQVAPLVTFDKPEHFYDRQPDSPRYTRSNRITWIQPKYDPDHPRNVGKVVELPASVLAKIPRGRGVTNAPLLRLLALAYVREQLRRGASQVEDRLLADRFGIYEVDQDTGFYEGLAVRQVARTRDKLAQAAVIELHDDGDGLPIYVMPDGTPGSDKTVDDFDPARTRRIRILGLDGDDGQEIVATDAQHAELSRRIRMLGHSRARTELRGLLDPFDLLDAARLIDRLSQMKTLRLSNEDPTFAARRTGLLPSTDDLSTSSLPPIEKGAGSRLDVEDDFSGQGEAGPLPSANNRQSADTRSQDPSIERREWSGDFPNLYYYADDRLHQQIVRFVAAIESRYGRPEAVGFLRWACLESTGSGLAVLELLRLRLPGVEPESHDPGAGDVLLDLDIFADPDDDERP